MIKGGTGIAVAAASLALSACWMSGNPLILAKDAEMPDVAGIWKSDAGKFYELKQNRKARNFSAESWTEADPAKGAETLTFDEIGKPWYIVQSTQSAGVRGYRIAKVANQRAAIYEPECNVAVTNVTGVWQDDKADCQFANLTALEEAARLEAARIDKGAVAANDIYTRHP